MSQKRRNLVTNDDWNVSTCSPVYVGDKFVPGVRLSVFSVRHGWNHQMHGYGNGMVFATREEANKWCVDHGYLKPHYSGTWCPVHRCQHYFLGRRSMGTKNCHLVGGESFDRKQAPMMWLPMDHPVTKGLMKPRRRGVR